MKPRALDGDQTSGECCLLPECTESEGEHALHVVMHHQIAVWLRSIKFARSILTTISLHVYSLFNNGCFSRTILVDCGSFVQFRVAKDGRNLVVVNMNTDHNHPVCKAGQPVPVHCSSSITVTPASLCWKPAALEKERCKFYVITAGRIGQIAVRCIVGDSYWRGSIG